MEVNNERVPDKGQLAAIGHKDGPMLVLAGPGSGKTFVITQRILRLIREEKIPPEKILVITFTKAAALEMQRRALSLDKRSAYVSFGTFHSVFYRILRISGSKRNLSLIAEDKKYAFFKAVLSGSENDARFLEEDIADTIKEISVYKNGEGEKPDHYDEYESFLNENGLLDFDDMLKLCFEMLRDDEKIRMYWQERFSYILVDEFQDSNPIQYEALKLLCNEKKNIFVVGDDDQSIYSFRGARPELMQKFEKEFEAKRIDLSVNYRSGKKIVDTAGKFIENNVKRYKKKIEAFRKNENEEIKITLSKDEEKEIFEKVHSYVKNNPGKTQAILLRTNSERMHFEKMFSSSKKKVSVSVFYDIYHYLRFINEGGMKDDFVKIMNKPSRFIARGLLLEDKVDLLKLGKRLNDKPWIKKRVRELASQCAFARKLDASGQLRYIYKVMGYETYLTEEFSKDAGEFMDAKAGFETLKEMARGKKNVFELMNEIKAVLDEETKDKESKDGMINGLSVMTYHGSKGLEFNRVYLPSLHNGQVPHGRMLTNDALEEERRMFYVAMTRAKDDLFMYALSEKDVSPFLYETGLFML